VSEVFIELIKSLYRKYLTKPMYYARSGLKYVSYNNLKLIEQNPLKSSVYAQLKREGHEVIQVILNDKYVGVIIDGQFHRYTDLGKSEFVTNLKE